MNYCCCCHLKKERNERDQEVFFCFQATNKQATTVKCVLWHILIRAYVIFNWVGHKQETRSELLG